MKEIEKDITVVVLDSGVDKNHKILQNKNIDGKSIINEGDSFLFGNDFSDELGHGTAVCGILSSCKEITKIYMIKVYSLELETEVETLIHALNYVKDNISCNIIHMSLGIKVYNHELELVCNELFEMGIVIVAAFDNEGAISFPAAFNNVIGIDRSYECVKKNDFIYVENSPVNILAKGGNHRLAWVNPSFIINQGTSFSCAYITVFIAKALSNGVIQEDIHSELKRNAIKVYNERPSNIPNIRVDKKIPFKINYAAIVPFNKEVHSILNFYNLINFEIVGFYDTRHNLPSKIIKSSIDGSRKVQIKDISQIEWSSIDTLIIGHLEELSTYSSRDIKRELLEKCLINNINVYCFDNKLVNIYKSRFNEKNIHIYVPEKNTQNICKKAGKLYSISIPIIGIFGTTTIQGKFTLQLHLRKLFIDNGYRVGQMGTEPSSLLFGMDDVVSFGYASTVEVSDKELIEILNESMFQINKKGCDVILVGSQSGTIPMYYNTVEQLHLTQLQFLLGTNPDIVILCVNLFDSIEYIRRTIVTIENLVECKIVALAISPLVYTNDWQIMGGKKVVAKDDELDIFKTVLKENFSLNAYVIGKDEDINSLFNSCIDFLSGG